MSVDPQPADRGFSWQFGLAAMVLGAAGSSLAASLAGGGPVPHPAPVVGELTYFGRGKAGDFAFVYASLVFGCLSYLALQILRNRLLVFAGPALERLLAYASLPAVFWVSGQVLGAPFSVGVGQIDTGAIWLSAILVMLSTAVCVAAGRCAWAGEGAYGEGVGQGVLAAILAGLSVIAAVTALARVFPMLAGGLAAVTVPVVVVSSAAAILAWLVLISRGAPGQTLGVRRLVVLAQIGLPLAFFTLLLPPASVDGELLRQAPVTPALLSVLSVLAVVGLASLVKAWRQSEVFAVPAMSVAAVAVLVLFADGAPIPYGMDQPADLYHHGEWLVPWDQWRRFGLLPYLDYSPSHGLINYLDGMANDALSDGTLAGFFQARQVVRTGVMIAAAAALCRFAGPLPALLGLLLFPVAGRYAILLLVVAGFCVLALASRSARPVSWLVLWTVVGTVLVFLAPGQGAMFVLAWAPVGAWQIWRAVGAEPRRLVMAGGAVVLVVLLAVLPARGPGDILFAKIRFILENRPLYTAVHGLDWRSSLEFDWSVNPVFFEILRNLWIVVLAGLAVFAVVTAWRIVRSGQGPSVTLCFAASSALFLLLVIPHTIGRIDPGGASRPGALSAFALALVCLPLLARLGVWQRGGGILLLAGTLGMLAPTFDHRPGLNPVLELPQTVRVVTGDEQFVDGRAIGVPAFGRTIVPTSVVDRMVLLNARLGEWLGADETYLDLTNANAAYFYSRRAVPIESGAILTLPAVEMQRRSVARLAETPPPVVLIGDHAGPAGMFTPSLRTPLLYRWVMEQIAAGRYGLVRDGSFLFAVAVDRLRSPPLGDEEMLNALDAIFARSDLGRLPSTWGVSADVLLPEGGGRGVLGGPQTLNGVAAIGADRYQISGADPYLQFEVPDDARDAGLLAFDISCADRAVALPQPVKLYYATPSDPVLDERKSLTLEVVAGRQIVPLDAYPRILIDGGIRRMRIDFEQPQRCREINLSAVALYDRPSGHALPGPDGAER